MQTRKIAILFNPSAGKGMSFKKKDKLKNLISRYKIPNDFFETQSEENLRNLAKELSGKYRTVVGAGGDSTFHIIVNEIMKKGTDTSFGMIGLGSSNDIAKEFEIDSLEKACAAIKNGRTRKIDLGCIIHNNTDLQYFLGQANVGLGVHVNKHVEELNRIKPGLGKMQSLAGALGIIHAYRSRKIPLHLTIKSEGFSASGEFLLAVFSNIRYWSTGKIIAPAANPDDGLLDSCLIRACSFMRLAPLVYLSKKGRHTGAKKVEIVQAKSFEISSEEPFEIQTDGQILGGYKQPYQFHEARFKILPRALRLIC